MPDSVVAVVVRRCAPLLIGGLLSATAWCATQIEEVPYHSWRQTFRLNNETVEVIVVPSIGRIMQFRFLGDEKGPFWENRTLDGKAAGSQSGEWMNFGGDKTWPAPQGEWAKVTGRGWPPPQAFDSMPVEASIDGEAVVLRSKIDPSYGIRTERRITLTAHQPEMVIATTYRKVEGPPIRVAIWTITQLNDPERVFLPVPKNSQVPEGYIKQSAALPAGLHVADSFVICSRSPKESTKIGSDAGDLVWADSRTVLRIHAPRESKGEFPDNGSSAEVYTNPDPNAYVELETLGPLQQLKRGQSVTRRQTYHLFRRTKEGSLEEQVQTILASP